MKVIERVVLIDDSEPDNIFHEMVLATADYAGDLKVFESPEQGLRYLQTQPDGPVDVVFLDINMPAMDGWAVLAELAPDLSQWPDLHIYMLTSSANPEDVNRARATPGVSGYLIKPLEPDTVRAMLAGQIDGIGSL